MVLSPPVRRGLDEMASMIVGRAPPALGTLGSVPPTAAEVTHILEEGTRRLDDGTNLPAGYVPPDLNSGTVRKMLGTERQPLCQEMIISLEE